MLWLLLLIMMLSVLIIASTSIGIECIGQNKKKQNNKYFLIAMLVCALGGVIGSGIGMIIKYQKSSIPNLKIE